MKRSSQVLVGALVALLAGFGVTPVSVRAGAPSDQLKGHIDRVLKTLEDPELKKEGRDRDRRLAVRKVANEFFDFGGTARRSLGRTSRRSSSTEGSPSSS